MKPNRSVRPKPRPRGRPFNAAGGSLPLLFVAAFLGFLSWSTIAGRLPVLVPALYLVASLITFLAYALDKSAAINEQWRIRESSLHLFALIGGWPGALAAQRLLRHKTQKRPFQFVFLATVAINCSATGWFASPYGASAFRAVGIG